jgi:hypothetical protein
MSLNGAIGLLIGLILVNYWLSRSVLYPPFLFCSTWLLDLTIYRFSPKEFDPLHTNTLELLAMGAVFFSLGGILAMLFPKALITARFVLTRFPPRNDLVKPAVILFLACGIPLLLHNLLILASQGTRSSSRRGTPEWRPVLDNSSPGEVRWQPISPYGRSTQPRCS